MAYTKQQSQSQPSGKPTPKFRFKVGRVEAAVWANGDFYNTTFKNSYKDKAGEWKETDSFGKADLAALAMAAQYAVTLILTEEGRQ